MIEVKGINRNEMILHCFDSLDEIKNSEINLNEIVDRWESLGFLSGLSSDKKEFCALGFEQMATLMLFSIHKFYEDYMEVIIFPCIRNVVEKVGEKYSTRKLYDSIYDVELSGLFDKLLFTLGNVDMEVEMVNIITNALVKIMNGDTETRYFYGLVSDEVDRVCLR